MTYAATPPPCKHCPEPVGHFRRRGLCRACYMDPVIRRQYPNGGTLAHHGTGNIRDRDERIRPLAPYPTPCEPGSGGKIGVMTMRDTYGYCVFHPNDAPLPPGARRAAYDRTMARLRHLKRVARDKGAHPCEPEDCG